METKAKIKKAGMGLAGAAAVAFMGLNVSGCHHTSESIPQYSTTPSTYIQQHSCKGRHACKSHQCKGAHMKQSQCKGNACRGKGNSRKAKKPTVSGVKCAGMTAK